MQSRATHSRCSLRVGSHDAGKCDELRLDRERDGQAQAEKGQLQRIDSSLRPLLLRPLKARHAVLASCVRSKASSRSSVLLRCSPRHRLWHCQTQDDITNTGARTQRRDQPQLRCGADT